jgi:hypothetical protein
MIPSSSARRAGQRFEIVPADCQCRRRADRGLARKIGSTLRIDRLELRNPAHRVQPVKAFDLGHV